MHNIKRDKYVWIRNPVGRRPQWFLIQTRRIPRFITNYIFANPIFVNIEKNDSISIDNIKLWIIRIIFDYIKPH